LRASLIAASLSSAVRVTSDFCSSVAIVVEGSVVVPSGLPSYSFFFFLSFFFLFLSLFLASVYYCYYCFDSSVTVVVEVAPIDPNN
jgi:hypothetical protein